MPLGTANGVLYLNGSKVVTSGSGLQFDGANTLQLFATGNAVVYFEGSSTNNSVLRLRNANTGALAGFYANNAKELVFEANGTSEQMRLTSTGLGIGTSSPGAKLHIKTGDTTQGLRFENASSIVSAVGFTSTYEFTVDAGAGAGGAFLLLKGGAPGSTGGIKMYTEGAERIHVKYTGQVRFIPLAADPAGAENGDVYYNSSTNKLRLYAGGGWTDLN
jgi:hypothetical protein